MELPAMAKIYQNLAGGWCKYKPFFLFQAVCHFQHIHECSLVQNILLLVIVTYVNINTF